LERKIRVAAVDYLNTKPLIYGFEKGMMQDGIDLVLDYPARIANMLLNDKADIGLVPVATLPAMKEYHIISDYCIGCDGEVASVCLFSEVPIAEIENVILDYQSRTSVALFKILLKKHWNISPAIFQGSPGYEERIQGTIAGLVIGDRALVQRKRSKYIYDLGSAWKQMTGLPFVFAAWVCNKKLSPQFIELFNAATGAGFDHLEKIVTAHRSDTYDLHEYYTKNIDYRLDDKKRQGLKLFLDLLSADK